MREQALISRRGIAAAIPLAAFIGGPAVAGAAHDPAGADAELLDLGRQWLASHVEHVAHWHAWQALPKAEAARRDAELNTECEVMSYREWALEERIHAISATTIAGLAVKARIAAHQFDVEDLDTASIERAKTMEGRDCQSHAALSIALDVLKLARSMA